MKNRLIGYRQSRQCVLAYKVGPRGGVREYLGGFTDLADLEDYLTFHGELYDLIELKECPHS